MIRSLVDISAEIVAKEVVKGNYAHIDYKLNSVLSEKIFGDLIIKSREFISDALLKEIGEKFNISKVAVEGSLVSSLSSLSKLGGSNIRELHLHSLNDFSQLDTYHSKKRRRIDLDIEVILKALLKSESLENLQYLAFTCNEYRFPQRWMRRVGLLLPSIKVVDIRGVILDKRDFLDLCDKFVNLISLDIRNTTVTDLTGISKLEKLIYLCIGDNAIKIENNIMDIFRLDKLRFLDLSSFDNDDSIDYVDLYAGCYKMLPSLGYIDCTNTSIRADDLRVMCERHPDLKCISLIGATRSNNIVLPGVAVLRMNSLKQCVEALAHYRKFNSSKHLTLILQKMSARFVEEFDDCSEEDAQIYLRAICSAWRGNEHNSQISCAAVEAFFLFYNNSSPEILNSVEKKGVVDSMIKVLREFNRKPFSNERTHSRIWRILAKIAVVPNIDCNSLYTLATKEIYHQRRESRVVKMILEVMNKIVVKLSPSHYDRRSQKEIERLIKWAFESNDSYMLSLMSKFCCQYANKLINWNLITATEFLELLYGYESGKAARIRPHDHWNSDCFFQLVNLLTLDNVTKNQEIVSYLATLHIYIQPTLVPDYDKLKEMMIKEYNDTIREAIASSQDEQSFVTNLRGNLLWTIEYVINERKLILAPSNAQ